MRFSIHLKTWLWIILAAAACLSIFIFGPILWHQYEHWLLSIDVDPSKTGVVGLLTLGLLILYGFIRFPLIRKIYLLFRPKNKP